MDLSYPFTSCFSSAYLTGYDVSYFELLHHSGPLKTVLGTTVKLNGSNYLLGAQAFRIFIGAQNKLAHLLQPPPAATNPLYVI